ncbi:MAG: hypothetical protein PVI09_00260 [Anaerolineae bacterium]|jgi:hypothetical protein
MANSTPRSTRHHEEALYKIEVQGHLDPSWSTWLDDLTIEPLANGGTLLTGTVRDQAALHGLLHKIRDLGLLLLSLERLSRKESGE